jgi:hypothetical protein
MGVQDFQKALTDLENGNRVRRKGWDDREFLYLVKGSTFQVNRDPLKSLLPENTILSYQSHIDRFFVNYADEECAEVWTPSMDDILAKDWILLDSEVYNREKMQELEADRRKELWPDMENEEKKTPLYTFSKTPPVLNKLSQNFENFWVVIDEEISDLEGQTSDVFPEQCNGYPIYFVEKNIATGQNVWKEITFEGPSEEDVFNHSGTENLALNEIQKRIEETLTPRCVLENGEYCAVVSESVPTEEHQAFIWLNPDKDCEALIWDETIGEWVPPYTFEDEKVVDVPQLTLLGDMKRVIKRHFLNK